MLCLTFHLSILFLCFFFNDTATTEIYTLSLHDALPISPGRTYRPRCRSARGLPSTRRDRKSTRLNSSHTVISYAVFCLKKKKTPQIQREARTKASTNPCHRSTIEEF